MEVLIFLLLDYHVDVQQEEGMGYTHTEITMACITVLHNAHKHSSSSLP